jgi:hypothetical protein
VTSVLDKLDELIAELSADQLADLDKLLAPELSKPWLATPGPQLSAQLSQADMLLFGGSVGGGKTDLLCGLALTEHYRTVVFRSQSSDLNGFWGRLTELCPNPVKMNSNLKQLTTTDGRYIECGHLAAPGAERSWQGRDHDLVCIDEAAQINPFKIDFVLGWLRSANGHRCRAILASNPPIAGEGTYLIEWFAPWVDPFFPQPAKYGELRWAVLVGNKEELKSIWVDGPEPVWVNEDWTWRLATQEEIDFRPHHNEVTKPLSRTFIPSRLDDNPYLKDTNYRAQIQSKPEPLRSQLLNGSFLAGQEDHEWQVLPSDLLRKAQLRWKEPGKAIMRSLGVDVAQGGSDKTCLVPLYDVNLFGKVKSYPGGETPDGPSVANLILAARTHGAAIAIDTTGGWGGSARDHLKTHHQITASAIVFSAGADGMDSETLLGFVNLRAKMYWDFRKALEKEDVALPPGDRILAQLSAARWKYQRGKIQIESKEEIRTRLGSSPDEADAIVMAWHVRERGFIRKTEKKPAWSGDMPLAQGWMGS